MNKSSSNIICSIFDLDGTLVNSRQANYLAYRDALQKVNIPLSAQEFNDYVGITGNETLRQHCSKYELHLDATELKTLRDYKNTAFLDHAHLVEPHEPTIRKLQTAAQTHYTAIASAGSRVKVDQLLKTFGLDRYLDVVICVEDVTRKKPDPECHHTIAKLFGVEPADCEVYDDSPAGLRAAEAFGARYVHHVVH